MHSSGDLHARRAAVASGSIGVGRASASALGLRSVADGASRDGAAKILAGRALAQERMNEAGGDEGFADAARTGKQVRMRRAVAQFGEEPICDFAMSADRGQGHGEPGSVRMPDTLHLCSPEASCRCNRMITS
jgi:hypothetical protein